MWPEPGSFRGVFVERQVAALRELGHHVDIEVIAQSRGKADYFTAIPRVRKRARSGHYDIVHIHYGLSALAARFAGRTPRVISLYGTDINSPKQRLLTRIGWRGTRAHIYVAARLAKTANDPHAHVVANGIDFKIFQPGDRAIAKRALGLREGVPVVLFGGAPDRTVKGYDVFAAVRKKLADAGVETQELILSAPDQPTEALAAKYDAADVLLFTSRRGSEASPTVVKEATAMGLPVVTVDVGDVKEILKDVKPHAIVDFPDPDDRVKLIDNLATETRAVLARGQRADGRESCAWLDESAVAERIVDVYRGVLRADQR
jgi:glycosyltransferase involved in cell wall biosynthesis